MSKQNKPFEIPEKFLNQINEVSNGGFILFAIAPDGSPRVFSIFDNSINALGLISYAKKWSSVVDDCSEDMIANSLTEEKPDEEDED